MSKIGYLWDSIYLGHDTGFIYPENPKRAEAIKFSRISADLPGLINIPVNFRLAHWVKQIHSEQYISFVEDAFVKNVKFLDRGETSVQKDTFDVATYSLCGALSLVQNLGLEKIDKGFAAIRPPGHHAGIHGTRGFCYFNNVAACARFAQNFLGLKRILIIDWDVHPGDGTTQIFYEDPDVFMFSIHQRGILSATVGADEQIGKLEGEGTTKNVNILEGAGGKEYMPVFEKELGDFVIKCKPELILISAGFDAHGADPLGGLNLSYEDFAHMTRFVMDLSKEYCGGKLISILEGGYNIGALYQCVREHVRILQEDK